MENKSYSGYTNYETWKLCLNLDNDEELYNKFKNYKGSYSNLKNELEDLFEVDNGYKIIDFWSCNEWSEIDWVEVLETRSRD